MHASSSSDLHPIWDKPPGRVDTQRGGHPHTASSASPLMGREATSPLPLALGDRTLPSHPASSPSPSQPPMSMGSLGGGPFTRSASSLPRSGPHSTFVAPPGIPSPPSSTALPAPRFEATASSVPRLGGSHSSAPRRTTASEIGLFDDKPPALDLSRENVARYSRYLDILQNPGNADLFVDSPEKILRYVASSNLMLLAARGIPQFRRALQLRQNPDSTSIIFRFLKFAESLEDLMQEGAEKVINRDILAMFQALGTANSQDKRAQNKLFNYLVFHTIEDYQHPIRVNFQANQEVSNQNLLNLALLWDNVGQNQSIKASITSWLRENKIGSSRSQTPVLITGYFLPGQPRTPGTLNNIALDLSPFKPAFLKGLDAFLSTRVSLNPIRAAEGVMRDSRAVDKLDYFKTAVFKEYQKAEEHEFNDYKSRLVFVGKDYLKKCLELGLSDQYFNQLLSFSDEEMGEGFHAFVRAVINELKGDLRLSHGQDQIAQHLVDILEPSPEAIERSRTRVDTAFIHAYGRGLEQVVQTGPLVIQQQLTPAFDQLTAATATPNPAPQVIQQNLQRAGQLLQAVQYQKAEVGNLLPISITHIGVAPQYKEHFAKIESLQGLLREQRIPESSRREYAQIQANTEVASRLFTGLQDLEQQISEIMRRLQSLQAPVSAPLTMALSARSTTAVPWPVAPSSLSEYNSLFL